MVEVVGIFGGYTFIPPLAFVKNVLGRHKRLVQNSLAMTTFSPTQIHGVVSGLVSDGFTTSTSMRTWSFLRADIAKANVLIYLVSDGTRVIIGSGERRQPEIKNKN